MSKEFLNNFKTFFKCFLANALKTFDHKHFKPIFSECLLNVYLQTFQNQDGGEQ